MESEICFSFCRRTIDLLVLIVSILNAANVYTRLIGEDNTSGGKPLVTGKNN